MKTVKVKVHPDTYRIIQKSAQDEGDTVEDFLEDFIEGSFGVEGPDEDEAPDMVPVDHCAAVVPVSKSRNLAKIPKEYQKDVEDLLNEQQAKGRDERMMNAVKYVVEMLMSTPGTGDRRDWAQQMLQDICRMNGDPYTAQVQQALDSLLKRSGYMDLFSFGRTNPPVPDMQNPGMY